MQRNLGRHPNSVNSYVNGDKAQHYELDACIVGAGFAGVYLLHLLRKEGFNAKIIEAGSALGGIWHWNSYPGARVDSQYPVYALSIPEVFNTWTWSEQYPGEKELKRYFQHVDNVLDISNDTVFNSKVVAAGFDPSVDKWRIECENGVRVTARYFIPCLGFAAKRYFPDWSGLEDVYKGYICHSSFWPAEGIDMKGKKVAVVGTGATGIQISQEAAKDASKLTCFVRTPNLCLPMRQGPVDPEQSKQDLQHLKERLGTTRFKSAAGFLYGDPEKGVFDYTPEEREAILEHGWAYGGFKYLHLFNDMLTSQEANDEIYAFWAKKRRAQMKNPGKRDLLAPETPPHPFAGKRPSLEQDYYEQMDKDHVTLVSVKETPVVKVVENGIVTEDGKLHEADIIAIATGFDSVTGGMKEIEITGLDGERLNDKWKNGTYTYLGMTVANFPNMMFTYGPQSPTAYANGPSIVEPQDEWIVDVMRKMRDEGKTRLNPDLNAELDFKKQVNEIHAMTLRDKVEGWYMGTNIPGKPREALNYAGGIPLYTKTIRDAIEPEWKGFTAT